MALKRKISKSDWEKLPEALQSEYKESGGSYILDIDGGDDLAAAKEREAEARKQAEKEAREAKAEIDRIREEAARKTGDIAALENSYKQKIADAEKKLADLEANHKQQLSSVLLDTEAERLANKLSTVPRLMTKEIRARLDLEFADGKPITRVLDANGKPSALSLGDLEKEIVANPDYKAIIKASDASGGAGKPSQPGGARFPNTNSDGKAPDLSAMSPQDLAAHMAAKREAAGA